MQNRPALMICASGMTYKTGQAAPYTPDWDFQKPYLSAWLRFLACSPIHEIFLRPTVGELETVQQAEAQAMREAKALATSF